MKDFTILHTNIYKVKEYSNHLKRLPEQDRISRFGYRISDYNIDQLILNIVYNPKDHDLWYALYDNNMVGWGHMARNDDKSWELAVSVDHDYQQKGVGDALIKEMLEWAKVKSIKEVFMHCIEDNRVIQHLAVKHNLQTRDRSGGERTAALEVPSPTFLEASDQLWKEQSEILKEFGMLQKRLASLWWPTLPK